MMFSLFFFCVYFFEYDLLFFFFWVTGFFVKWKFIYFNYFYWVSMIFMSFVFLISGCVLFYSIGNISGDLIFFLFFMMFFLLF